LIVKPKEKFYSKNPYELYKSMLFRQSAYLSKFSIRHINVTVPQRRDRCALANGLKIVMYALL